MITPEQIARLRILCAGVTQEPWRYAYKDNPEVCVTEHCVVIGESIAFIGIGREAGNNAHLIAEAATILPTLLDEIEALQKEQRDDSINHHTRTKGAVQQRGNWLD